VRPPKLLVRHDVVCRQAVELVTGYLEGTLTRAGRPRFEAHLAGCPHCTEYSAQMRKTIELTRSLTLAGLTPRTQYELIVTRRQCRAEPYG
jgi:anti-sigma factor RsiW